MKRYEWSRESWVILAVVAAALVLRFYLVGWGLPYVYEEATPLKKAWSMGEWGSPQGVDLNPHFFNYPSLTIYLQFIAQGLLFVVMKLRGLVDSGVEFHARYVVDPTPFYYAGRAVSVFFGAATVWLTYLVARRFAANWVAAASAALLAVNTFHISRCHLIEVDVPLTFFVMLSFWLALRTVERPTAKSYLLAGMAVGLTASTKYTGAMLLLPLLVAHLCARRGGEARPGWSYPLLSLAAAGAAFVLTSPYVLLDAGTFAQHFGTERQHMRLGHFGATGSPTWAYYMRVLARNLLGTPAAVLALAGLVYAAAVRRRRAALVLAAFVVPYLLAVSTWSMRADRYLLPVLPALLIFAVAALGEVLRTAPSSRWPARFRAGGAAVLVILLAVPVLAAYPPYLRRVQTNTRTTATRWVEANVPSGSFLVVEPYGPALFGPDKIAQVSSAVRREILELERGRPNYAILQVPMFQVVPERSEVFYDHALYENADYFVSTDAVRARYEKDPTRFRRQLAFYDILETGYTKVAEFIPGWGGGSVIAVFKNPRHDRQFSERDSIAPPRPLQHERETPTGSEELFYYSLGVNYELFLRLPEAIACYELAFRYPIVRTASFKNLVLRKTHCLVLSKRRDEAIEYLDTMISRAPTPRLREQLMQVRRRIAGGASPGKS